VTAFAVAVAVASGLWQAWALEPDTDRDGMSDAFEDFFGLSSTNATDAARNYDADLLANEQESLLWTDPFVADTDWDGWPDHADSNALSRAVIYWGHRLFTRGDHYDYPGPTWWLGAEKVGGEWGGGTWHVSPHEPDELGRLLINLDRATLTNSDGNSASNVVIDVILFDHDGGSLFVDLLDSNRAMVAANLHGNLMAGTNLLVMLTLDVPWADHPDAATIQLRRGAGEVTVYETILYVDEDGDGLDADQEQQLGTSDFDADSDDDGLSDHAEAFTHRTNPTIADIDGDGISDGAEVAAGTDPLAPPPVQPPVNRRIVHVDGAVGHDNNDGFTRDLTGGHGPKRTIQAGIDAADSGDVVQVASGDYSITGLNLQSKNITIRPVGSVVIKPQGR